MLDLKSYPQILPFIESIRATLAGDRARPRTGCSGWNSPAACARWILLWCRWNRRSRKRSSQVRIDGSAGQIAQGRDSRGRRRSFADDLARSSGAMNSRRARGDRRRGRSASRPRRIVVARARYITDLSAFLPAKPTPMQQLLVDQLRDGPALAPDSDRARTGRRARRAPRSRSRWRTACAATANSRASTTASGSPRSAIASSCSGIAIC